MKKLVIISGVTGAIGSALLAEYAQEPDTIIYGISRKALPVEDFVQKNGKLPLSTLICSIPDADQSGYESLVKRIDFSHIDRIVYIHTLGLFPFEVNQMGGTLIQNDFDGDGVNDHVMKLSYTGFISVADALIKSYSGNITCALFGSLSDKHKPTAHSSWWKTIEKTKEYMKSIANDRISMFVFNISSVICPHEIITRPFVFSQTDAEQQYWLHPHELAQFVLSQTNKFDGGFHEIEKYRIYPNFDPQYYTDSKFTPRKIAELYPVNH